MKTYRQKSRAGAGSVSNGVGAIPHPGWDVNGIFGNTNPKLN